MPNVFTLRTGNIIVSAQPEYMTLESSPVDAQYIWVYHIKIKNNGKHAVQLLNRYWHITDGHGLVQEVHGSGVIGMQPVILPGEDFEYTSSVSLTTPTGMMHGTYEMKNSDETLENVLIPVFSLDSDETLRMAN